MSYTRPDLSTLITRTMGDVRARTEGQLYRRSAERVIGFAVAGLAHSLHGHLDHTRKQLLPLEGDEETVTEWAELYEVARKGGTVAAGTVKFERTGSPTIPSGTAFQSEAGLRYVTTSASTVLDPTYVSATARALEVGEASDLDVDAVVRLISPIAGVGEGKVHVALSGGTVVEPLERWRHRVLAKIRRASLGGIAGNYEGWALEVPGVTRAWERPHRYGVGTVSLAFVMDDRANRIPLPADVATVQAYLESKRPLDMRAVYVAAPVPVPVDMTIALRPNTSGVRATVTTALDELFAEVGLEDPLALSQIGEVISTAAGETAHEIVSHSSLEPGTWGILTRGALTFEDL